MADAGSSSTSTSSGGASKPAGKPSVGPKKKLRKGVTRGVAHVKATFNNTLVTITDTNGETISWASAGTVGFKGARKSTPFAAGRAAEKAANEARKHGMLEVEVKVKGPGSGRPKRGQGLRRREGRGEEEDPQGRDQGRGSHQGHVQ